MILILLIVSSFLYVVAPSEMNIMFVVANTLIFLCDTTMVLKNDRKRVNLVNFNLLFFVSFFMCTYFLPLIVIPAEGLYSIKLIFDYHVMNKCLSLSTISITIYSLVYIITFRKYIKKRNISTMSSNEVLTISKYIKPLMNVTFLLLVVILLRFMNTSHDVGIEVDGPPFVFVFFIVAVSLSLILSVIRFDFSRGSFISYVKKNRWLLSQILFVLFLYLLIGDRLVIVQLASVLLVVYSTFVSEIKLKNLVVIGTIGFLLMVFINLTRNTGATIREGNIGASMNAASSTFDSYYQGNALSLFSDLSERFMELCVGYDYVQKHGVQYPLQIFPILISPIPLLPNLMTQLIYGVPMAETSPGYIVAQETDTPAGSHCVLSVYGHWGLLGVVVGFSIFAYIIAFISSGFNKNIYYGVSYMILVSLAVFTPRAGLFDFYRPLIWGILLVYFLTHLKGKRA